eukprot:gene16546-22775_t
MAWQQQLKKAIDKNRRVPYGRYVQLATIKPNGRPANRTIVFRGFMDNEPDALTFCTDKRSSKVTELAQNPWGEVAWYFTETREQYRISGKLIVVPEGHPDEELRKARQALWSKMSPSARVQFSWPTPGMPRLALGDDGDIFEKPDPGPESPALPDFCLVILQPDEIDIVQLKQNRRMHYEKKEAVWTEMIEMNP